MLFYFNISYHIIFYPIIFYQIKSDIQKNAQRLNSIRFFSCRVEHRESIEGQKNPEPVSDLFLEKLFRFI